MKRVVAVLIGVVLCVGCSKPTAPTPPPEPAKGAAGEACAKPEDCGRGLTCSTLNVCATPATVACTAEPACKDGGYCTAKDGKCVDKDGRAYEISDCERAFDNVVRIMEADPTISGTDDFKKMKSEAEKTKALVECKKEKPEAVKCMAVAKDFAGVMACSSGDIKDDAERKKAVDEINKAVEEAQKAADEAAKAAQQAPPP